MTKFLSPWKIKQPTSYQEKEVKAILENNPNVAKLEDGDYVLVNTIEKSWKDILQKEGEKDACYYKVKSRYKKWPSAYAEWCFSPMP